MDIEKSLELCSKATPAPWHVMPSGFSTDCQCKIPTVYAADASLRYIAQCRDFFSEPPTDNLANAAFIADARENFPEALRIIKRLRELLDHDSLMLPDSTCVEVRSLLSLDGKDGA